MKMSHLQKIVKAALIEDIGSGDITTNNLIPASTQAEARFIFKSEGIVCGLNAVECAFKFLDPQVSFRRLVKEGTKVKKGTIVAVVKGKARALLSAERVAINLLMHLSGVATRTRAMVDRIKPYKTQVLDSRKTTPMLRELERYAVRTGGGVNHRFNLADMAMIKDNHRFLLGRVGLKEAVEIIKKKTGRPLILEVDTLTQLKEALTSRADVILLDNMTPAQVKQAVVMRDRAGSKILLEASGGISLDKVHAYAKTGVERISVGSLTSIKQGVDISLDFI